MKPEASQQAVSTVPASHAWPRGVTVQPCWSVPRDAQSTLPSRLAKGRTTPAAKTEAGSKAALSHIHHGTILALHSFCLFSKSEAEINTESHLTYSKVHPLHTRWSKNGMEQQNTITYFKTNKIQLLHNMYCLCHQHLNTGISHNHWSLQF